MAAETLEKSISLLYRYAQSYFNMVLSPYNIGSGQYIFLLCLLENDGINQEQLANIVRVDKTTTARAVAKLIQEGYVTREKSPRDKRAYILHVTAAAKGLLKPMQDMQNAWNEELFQGFSPAEKKQTEELISRLTANVLRSEQEIY